MVSDELRALKHQIANRYLRLALYQDKDDLMARLDMVQLICIQRFEYSRGIKFVTFFHVSATRNLKHMRNRNLRKTGNYKRFKELKEKYQESDHKLNPVEIRNHLQDINRTVSLENKQVAEDALYSGRKKTLHDVKELCALARTFLTEREMQILEYRIEGKSYDEIRKLLPVRKGWERKTVKKKKMAFRLDFKKLSKKIQKNVDAELFFEKQI